MTEQDFNQEWLARLRVLGYSLHCGFCGKPMRVCEGHTSVFRPAEAETGSAPAEETRA
jgi:hypothetical protein